MSSDDTSGRIGAVLDELDDDSEVAEKLRDMGDRQRASLIARALGELGQDHGDVDVYAEEGYIDTEKLAEKVVELLED